MAQSPVPGQAHDVIEDAIAKATAFMRDHGLKRVIDMDLSKCFDTLDHELIIQSVGKKVTDGSILNLIRKFLEGGVMKLGGFEPASVGSPQGGVISPLLAIDEISIGPGHNYLTVVLDLDSCAVVFVGEGKGSDALISFWRRLKCSKATIEAVAIDMSRAYIQAVRENLPRAPIVFDHFHVIKLYNDRLSDFRRHLLNQIEDPLKKQVVRGTRWLLLKNPENLNADRSEPNRLKAALELNQPLAAAYYMKEDLRQAWNQTDKETAKEFLTDWVYRAGSSMIPTLMNMARTIANHFNGILAYYDFPISTGLLEGTNNKIKTIKRQAYGFRDNHK